MIKIINWYNLIVGTVIAVLSNIFGPYWQVFIFYLLFNVLDYLTRWIAARRTKTEESAKAETGIYKKVSLWVLILVAFSAGYILTMLINDIFGGNINLLYIGWVVLGMLMINEIRSICENLIDAGVEVPAIISKGLKVAESVINNEEGDSNND